MTIAEHIARLRSAVPGLQQTDNHGHVFLFSNALPGLLDALEVAAEALGTIRVHLMCEVLPGAHRTEMPLTEVNEALAKIKAALNKEQS